jgi:DeoR family glycerol-3-phosphate regulon repressor
MLIDIINRRGYINATEMALELNVSDMTIRRDLDQLAKQGLIIRDHGGATAVHQSNSFASQPEDEPSFISRQRRQQTAKARIAKAALSLIQPGESIGLDTGTTTYALAELIVNITGLQIFTSSLPIAECLSHSLSSVYMLGGAVRPNELSVYGPTTNSQLRSLWLDKVFIGIAGILESGIYEYTLEDTEVKQTFIERGRQTIILCDADKFDHVCLAHIANLEAIHTFITDELPPKHIIAALKSAEVNIIVAE